MTTVNNIFGLDGLGAEQPARQPVKSLGQEQFLELMVAQLRNQDPMKPMQNGEFLGQLAQFGTVNGIQELQQSFGALAGALQSNQALMASSLVGQNVLVPAETASLAAGGTVSGAVELPNSTGNLVVEVTNANGEVVRRIELGSQQAGMTRFTWDGRGADGAALPPGEYQIKAQTVDGGATIACGTLISAKVDSVSLGGTAGIMVNVAGIGSIPLSQIRQIG
jgi:flagellar basal-body rod modification protein FlgD